MIAGVLDWSFTHDRVRVTSPAPAVDTASTERAWGTSTRSREALPAPDERASHMSEPASCSARLEAPEPDWACVAPAPIASWTWAFSASRLASSPTTSVYAASPIHPLTSCVVPKIKVTSAPEAEAAVTVTSSLTRGRTPSRVITRSVEDCTEDSERAGGRKTVNASRPTSTHTSATTPTHEAAGYRLNLNTFAPRFTCVHRGRALDLPHFKGLGPPSAHQCPAW